ncbi:MAG: adenine deaminase [Candidatus Rokubacteria bacterium]|nr:adenine deaminase [Candidatus Rokubacteria bacterium]
MTSSRWVRERRALTAVARGAAPADRYVEGGTLLNVYTGECYAANVAIKGERIAYVGESGEMVGPRTEVISARGRILCPGYVEPHSHPWNLVTPAGLARHVLPLGTTTIFADNLPVYELAGPRGFEAALRALARLPLKFYWTVRVHSQSRSQGEARRFPLGTLARLLDNPWVAAVGEITRWPEVLEGDRGLLARLALAVARRKRIEGHTAGASAEKLIGLAAGGIASCHEPITAQEALDRARAGIAVMLRQSSLRPDLKALLSALKDAPALASRLMLTMDGSGPAYVAEHGFVDHLVEIAIAEGVRPAEAYRMVTLNPASYYGLDHEIGGLAPGRFADVLFLHDLSDPRPERVIARGRVVAEGGRLVAKLPEPAWQDILSPEPQRLSRGPRLAPEDFSAPGRQPLPVIRLVSTVITRLEERRLAEGDLLAVLLDRQGRWICRGVVAGFARELDGLASTLSTDFQILVLGRDPSAMARAVNRLREIQGGIVVVEGGRVIYELALPLGGIMAAAPLPELAARERELQDLLKARGYPSHDLLFTLLFLTADFLPEVRLTARGVWDVKRRKVLSPSRPLSRRR